MHWPFRQPETARGVRRSVLHDRLAARGAGFGVVAGWERANWFATAGVEPRYVYTYGRQNWFPCAAAEHRAVREAVGLFDQSSLAKLLVQGPDATATLQRLCANDVDVAVGRIVYTQMLNARGGIECDLTVTRLADDAYLVVTVAAAATHDADWIRRGSAGARVTLTDLTSAFTVLGVMGPRSRELLARLTDADLSNASFPFGTTREIAVGYATVRATRITYVGELGWELYAPTEFAMGVYDDVVAAGGDVGLRHAGYHAMDSLRMEKGYRSWGHDIGGDDTPLEAGLGFTVRWDKPGGFIGREALLAQRARGLSRRLLLFALEDPEAVAWGDEPILRDGRVAGTLTSAAHGHTLGRPVAMGYVACTAGAPAESLLSARYEIDIAGTRIAATPALRAWVAPREDR
jgi:4-methylaminobutanoate oxidase (formaldehyde-forming)